MKILVAMPKGVIRDSFIPPAVAAELETLGEVVWNEGTNHWTEEELADRIPGFDVCVTGWSEPLLDKKVVAKADKLKLIAHTGGSTANYAGEALYDAGIGVISGNELYARSVAECVVAYALYMLRDIGNFNRELMEKGWSQPGHTNAGLLDRKVGLIGFGAIARYAAEMLRAFDVELLISSNHLSEEDARKAGGRKASMEEVLSTCDVISVHLAKTPATYHVIDREKLALIREGAILINTARGNVIDEAALADELATGRFRAALDVYEVEPLPMFSPLRKLDNVLLMPHNGGPTIDRRPFVTKALIREIPRKLAGESSWLDITREMNRRMTRE